MTRFGLDSVSPVPAWAHHQAGSTVALRYLSRSTGKVITRAEHDVYRKHGIDLALVFEDMGRPDQRGYDGGKADAEFALGQALDILGRPSWPLCIRFAADADLDPQSTDAYYDGAAAVLGHARCGPYGSYRVVAHQAARGFRTLWQTYAWSGGQQFLGSSLYQYANNHTIGGVGVDYNHVYGEDFGQWDRKPPISPDPHHYRRFDTKLRLLGGRTISEVAAVTEYDRLRAHPFIRRPRLHALRTDLRLLAGRVYQVAHDHALVMHPGAGAPVTVPAWGEFHRGWRYQALIHRAQGQRIV